MLSFASMDEAQSVLLHDLLSKGVRINPRGLGTAELFPASFELRFPRRRCIANPARRWSLPLAIGELCWHLAGSTDVEPLAYYAPRWRQFTDVPGVVRGGCYGHRVFGTNKAQESQWERVKQILRADLHSRRAVLTLGDPQFVLDSSIRDVSCACTLQFLVREGRLHAMAYMRSNDVIWGMPYDIFLFTMLQELLAAEFGLPLGSYFHFAGSLHLYDHHVSLAHRIVAAPEAEPFEMPPIVVPAQSHELIEAETQIRKGSAASPQILAAVDPYWGDLIRVLQVYAASKGIGDETVEPTFQFKPYTKLLHNVRNSE